MKAQSVTTKIQLATVSAVLALALCLMLVMAFFMNSLTDSVMLGMLQPMARTAAQNVENRLHTLAERFLLLRESPVIRDGENVHRKQEILAIISSGREYAWLGLYEPDGSLLTGSDACPRTIAGRELYPLMLETGNLVIEKTTIGTSGLEIAMGVPVAGQHVPGRNDGRRLSFYLVGSYKYDVLSDVLRDINIGSRGTAFILDQNGYIIAHKDLGRVFSQEPVRSSLGGGAEAESLFLSMVRRQTGSAKVDTPGGDLFVGFSPVKGTLWVLGIQAPRGDFMAATRQALFLGALITLAVLLGTVLFVGLFNRKVLSVPLAAITANARQLARGNFSGGLPFNLVRRRDEIGQLADAFNSMSASVHGVIRDISGLTVATGTGNLEARADPEAFHGDFKRIVTSLNASLDGVCSYLDSMPDALLLLDARQEPLYHNSAMAAIMERHGLKAEKESLVARLLSGGTQKDFEMASGLFDASGQGTAEYECEIGLQDIFGLDHSYTLSLGRLYGPDGSLCVMLILNDVTALTRARSQAEAASLAKSDFLSRMSHEMRTPMNAIIGMAAIGLGADEPERKHYCLDKIAGASQHLLGVINDILDMSKIEADKFELFLAPFNLAAMLERVVDVVRFQTEAKKLRFAVFIDSRFPSLVVADEQRLAQVVTNLLSNAVKFTPENGVVTLQAEMRAEDEASCAVNIAVSDTGIGLTEEQQSRLFRPFEQADGSISRQFGGTGLGLAISKRIIEKMGGTICVASAFGQGATFTLDVTVPKGTQSSALTDGPAAPAPPGGYTPGIFSGKRVLLAEDVEINREIVHTLLEPTGLDMIFARDGQETVDIFLAAPEDFDLILMDVQMPLVDGYEATRRIRASGLPGAGDIPIIAMTANVFREDIERCLASGMNGHLGKPIDADEVVVTLSRYLGRDVMEQVV